MCCTCGMLDGGLNATRTFTGAPVDRPASAPSGCSPSKTGSSAEPPHGLLWSLPCIVWTANPWPNSTPRAAGMAIMARASAGSSPSNHGSPSPMGSPTMARSTLEPMEFRCFLVVSISSAMLFAASGSRHRSASQVSLAQRGGQRSVDCASTSPTAPRWASMPMPRFSSHGRRTAATATKGAVIRALDVPPPRRSASPLVRFIMTMSWCPGRG